MNYTSKEIDEMLDYSDNQTEKQSHLTMKSSVKPKSYLKSKSKASAANKV